MLANELGPRRLPTVRDTPSRTALYVAKQQKLHREPRGNHGGRQCGLPRVSRLDVVTTDERSTPLPAAAPGPAAHAAVSTSVPFPVPGHHTVPPPASPLHHIASGAVNVAHAEVPPVPYTSLEPELLSTLSSSVDSVDGEMCVLVSDPTGDVQLVCDSDPGHPVSLAESAALRPALPTTLLQDIEAKLEADLSTIAVTILFALGFISLEWGVNDLIEHYFGDSLLSDVMCVSVGLVVVFWVRLSKARLMRFDRWR